MSGVLTERKIDGHCHVLDPARFPYSPEARYHPAGQEMGNAESFLQLMDCYAVQHALLVGPNSGYATDNRCLLHTLQLAPAAFRGIAVVPNDCPLETLADFKARGVIGIAFNPALMGFEYYAHLLPLLQRLRQLDLWAQFQVEGDLLPRFLPMIEQSGAKVMIDHCGRPSVADGVQQAGFQALLALGRTGQAVVKLSGFAKFSREPYPFEDVRPFVDALARDFGLDRCVWASDWPYLRAPFRLDYGPMLKIYERWFSASERQQMMWDSPKRHFGF